LKRENHNFALIVLRDEDDNERIKKRIEITKSLLVRQLGGVNELTSQGKSFLARLFSLIMSGDFLSVYLAIIKETDPTPVEAINRLKKELSR
jgi:glucose/mannose-6-phosphate isomerase